MSMFENEFTEEEMKQEMISVLATCGNKGLTKKELYKKVLNNLNRKHLQIHLDVMVKEGVLDVDKTGGYSVTEKAVKLSAEGKIKQYTKDYAKKYHSDGTLKKKN